MTTSAPHDISRSRTWASGLLLAYGVVFAANWVVAVVRGTSAGPIDLAFSALVLVVTVGAAWGLRRGAKWAWLTAVAVSLGALFFIAPVVGTILLGGGTEPVGTGWDVVYFPLMTGLLISIVVLLARDRGRAGRRTAHE